MFTQGFTGDVYAGQTIHCEVDGFTLTATIHEDTNYIVPWEDCPGHGPVSPWTRRPKRPGERILNSDRGSHRYYDFQAAMVIAKRDGWGPRLPHRTAGQAAAAAVEADFEVLRGWCNDDWRYVGVAVTVSRNGITLTGEYDHALWGVSSCDGEYITSTANDYVAWALDAAHAAIKGLVD